MNPPPGNPRFPLFDGLRALAALSVLTYHVGFFSRANEGENGISPYLARLNVGVAVFFVISGFLLYRPFLAAREGSGPPIRLRDYFRRRILRIVPAYWVALTVLGLYPGLPGLFTGRWWVYYVFGQDYSRGTILRGIGPAWSLGCEVVFYLLLPFISLGLSWLVRRVARRRWWVAELGGLCLLMLMSTAWRAYADSHPSIPSPNFASTFLWFALGMLLALASVAGVARARRWHSVVVRYSWAGWGVAAIAYLVICRGLGLGGGPVFLQRVSPGQDLAVYVLSGLVAVGLALPAVFQRGHVERHPLARGLAWLGLISYGIYLYHYPIADALNGGVNAAGHPMLRFLALGSGTLIISLLAAAASYYLVERPLLRLKERRSRLEPAVADGPS